MPDRVPESLDGVPGQRSSRGVGDGAGDPQRHANAELLEDALDGVDRRLGVQDVEDGLDHEEVGATDQQPARGLGVGLGHLVERHGPRRRVGHVRRDGESPVRRPQRPGHEPRPAGLDRLGGVGGGPGDPSGLDVDLVGHVLEPVVGLGDPRGRECVCRDDVGAGGKVRVVDRAHHARPGQDQQGVVAADVAGMIPKALAAKIGLCQAVTLDERPGRAVEHEDSLAQKWPEQEQALLARPNGVVWYGCVCGRDRRSCSLGGPASLVIRSLPGAVRKRRIRMVRPVGRPLSGSERPL